MGRVTLPARGGPLSREELRFYSRHLLLPEVGLKGQERLKAGRVLVVGAGGLGSPASLYLAAAGVGTIGLTDPDTVDVSNLHRQVLYSHADVGRPKVEAARERLTTLNPHVEVVAHREAFTSANALDLLRDYDVLVDGSDNFPTRYLANDAAALSGKPHVYGSIYRFEGQASVFDAARGPCYRCLHRAPPPPDLVPTCAEGGVLGVLPAIVGSIQATEAVKLLLGAGDTLAGRLLLFDALEMRFTELQVRKDPDCPLCGPKATLRGLVDYEEFCGLPQARAHELDRARFALAPAEVARRRESGRLVLLDVREPHEWEIARIDGAKRIPLGELTARAAEVPLDRDVVVVCRSGVRSARATELLRGLGYGRVWNLEGGLVAWSREVDPSVPWY